VICSFLADVLYRIGKLAIDLGHALDDRLVTFQKIARRAGVVELTDPYGRTLFRMDAWAIVSYLAIRGRGQTALLSDCTLRVSGERIPFPAEMEDDT
jgi:hypothetical protein